MEQGVAQAHAYIDAGMAHIMSKSSKPVSCKAGCYHCCREPVYAEKAEVQALLASLPPETLPELRKRALAWWQAFHAARLDKAPETPARGDFRPLLAYRQALLWCPLLQDGLCMAYSHRPMNCRAHLATGPAQRCADDARRPRQEFVSLAEGEFYLEAVSRLANGAPCYWYEWDHLGIWIGRLLLGLHSETAAAHSQIVQFK